MLGNTLTPRLLLKICAPALALLMLALWAYYALTPGPAAAQQGSPATDRAALVALYNATDGTNWTQSDNWLSDAPIGQWYGVSVDSNGRVTWLDLISNYLRGRIPAELGNLTNLRMLSLDGNQLSGVIPSELGNLTNLDSLSLTSNQLSGTIPSELGNLANLEYLQLIVNQLSGTIPAELGKLTNLWMLSLDGNQLSGTIPVELGNLTNLRHLYLGGNQLSGTIPRELGNLTNLAGLNLGENQLSGCVPDSLNGQLSMDYSNLGGLSFCSGATAPTPTAIPTPKPQGGSAETDRATLVALYDATGGNNWRYNGNWKSSLSLERWYGVRTDSDGRVIALDLSGNLLTGEIPSELENLTNLWSLSLGWNRLSGTIPRELSNMTNLRSLRLSENELSGTIPAELGNLANLEVLELGFNQLSGTIPAELGNLTNLWSLSLGWNRLSGTIPAELGNLTNLGSLDLRENRLRGTIPTELGNLTKLGSLFLTSNQLSGTIPAELGNLANLRALYLGSEFSDKSNQFSGCVPDSLNGQLDMNSSNLGGLLFCSSGGTSTRPPPKTPTPEPTPRTPTPTPAPTATPVPPPTATPEPTPTPDPVKGDDRAALVALYNATGGDKWEHKDNWNTDAPLDTWYGVTTDRDGYVIKLSLPGKEGSRKRLTGEIPAELGSLTRLVELDLSDNFLSGKIPFQLNNLTKLETLNLRGNSLEGPIPIPPPEGEGTTLGSLDSLKALDLGRNELNGGISAELVKLRNLEELRLDGNELSGTLPVQWGNGLKVVDLSRNDFTGGIPAGLAELPNLEELRLDWNELSGVLPVQWGGMLRNLSLTWNKLDGEIPEALGTLANLETLALGHNNFSGCIPVSLRGKVTGAEQRSPHPPLPNCPTQGELDADRAALREFYKLTGGSAWDTGKTWKVNDGSAPVSDDWAGVTVDATGRVTELVLEDSGLNNNKAGIGGGFYSLEMLGNLTELTKLDLSGNSLGGELPYRLDSLVNLAYLDLSNNAFSGGINRTDLSEDQSGDEIEWKNLTKLEHLDLSENNNDCTFGSFGSCKRLNGWVPRALMSGATEFPALIYLDLSGNGLTYGAGDLLEKGNFGDEDGEMQINLSGNPWTYEPEEYRDYWTEFEAEVTRGFVDLGVLVAKKKYPNLAKIAKGDLNGYLNDKAKKEAVETFKVRAAVIIKEGSKWKARTAAFLVRGITTAGTLSTGLGWVVFSLEAISILNAILDAGVEMLQNGPGAMIDRTSSRILGDWWSCALKNGLENAPVEEINEKCGEW